MNPAPPVTMTFTLSSPSSRRARSSFGGKHRRHLVEARHHPEIVAPLGPRRLGIIADERADASGAPGLDVARLVAHPPGTGEIERQVGGRLQDHARPWLPPGGLPSIGANTLGWMMGRMVNGGDGDAVAGELAAHPTHQRREIGLAIKAAADPGLIG